MRIVTGLASVFMLLPFVADEARAAQEDGAKLTRRPAIQRLLVENRNNDSVIVLLSRPSTHAPFRHASRLKPGASETLSIPNQPWLLVRVLTDDDVRRAARETEARRSGSDGKRNNGLGLALALAGNRKNRDSDDRRENKSDDPHESEQDRKSVV